ncbi:MAG: serine protease [Cyclobacteriaceae bacterium]
MKVKVIAKLNKRLWPSTKNTPLPNPLIPNDILEVVEEVRGEAPPSSENSKWYKTDKGFYVWSEGVQDLSNENLMIKIAGNTFPAEQLSGTYWQQHFASLQARSDIFSAIGRFEIKGRPEFVATGFCIDDRHVLTCKHVVSDFATGSSDHWKVKKNLTCTINFQAEGNGTQNSYALARNVRIHLTADLAVVEFVTAPGQQPPARLELAPASVDLNADDPLVVIGHPAETFDGTKKLSTASLIKKYNTSITYNTIVRKGSSGSPVLNNAFRVAGIHSGTKTVDGSLSAWGSHHLVIHNFLKTL